MKQPRSVVIYRDHLGLYSETFITAQAQALQSFQPWFLCARATPEIRQALNRAIVVNSGGVTGRLREFLFRRWSFGHGVRSWLGNLQPKLLHAHFGPDGATIMPLAQALKLPLIVTFHGYDATVTDAYARKSFYAHRLYLRRRARLQEYGSQFIAVSEFVKLHLVRQGYPEERILVHYIGIDVDMFQADVGVTRERTVLFVGRLVPKKGCRYVIDALTRLREVGVNANLVVIGDGPLRAELEAQAQANLTGVRFLGAQPAHVVREWMNRARVFSVPSTTAENGDAEAFGMVFAEAQAMGLPVASFAHGGIPEAVDHGVTGLLAPEGDTDGLAANIRLLLEDDDLWQSMSAAGPLHVRERFNLVTQTRLLEVVYATVAAA